MSTYSKELPKTIYLTDDGSDYYPIRGSNLGWYESVKTAKRYGEGRVMRGTITWEEVDSEGNPLA